MKKIIICLLATVFFTGCTDLKEEILNEQDGSKTLNDIENMGTVVAPAYAYLRDIQNRSGVWGTILATTDEMAWPARGSDWVNANQQTLTTHEYTPQNTYIRNTWNSFLIGITKANLALYYLDRYPQTEEVKLYQAEVKFVRALCMFLLNDNFGKFPFREFSQLDYSASPQILTRETAVPRMIQELTEIIPVLKKKTEVPYGRISKAAAQMLLAKIYLNYKVYLNQEKWQEVIALCDDIINSGQYKIADDYWALFQYDNAKYGYDTESILSVIYDENLGLTGSVWVPITLHYNQKFGSFTSLWNGCCTTETFFDTWNTSDLRFKDTRLVSKLGFNQGFLVGQQYGVDGTALKTRTGEPLIFTKQFNINNSSEQAGVRVVKYAPDPLTKNTGAAGNDFHFYRLADTYLMRAEAKFRNGDASGALGDINILRAKRSQAALLSVDLEKIYNERGYELYWEGHRRNDMVRFGTYTAARDNKNYISASYKVLLPIPISALEANPELKQNTGY
ncbi:RagB/SusD family nutrient uptake outer membrane protein [Pedobacter sp. SL55]|uniref:RagB/SusD family nutrient uptake outer membrane protein n=1 Tax=Pedobacter sp. SL55 TaxID=2995161 RepID=UPI00226D787F|nr:RagB/SusD family nutrient uptake outer membrane protein [Pedobacter sp. SL55]WAC42373.1 RagB/SusD family nutrient uptake outer membrane protein [Pedobacter sp. SL55]